MQIAEWIRARGLAMLRSRWLRVVAGVLAVYAFVGFLLVPWIIKWMLVSYGDETLGRPLAIGSVRLNPFALSLTIEGFDLKDKGGHPLLSFNRFYVNFQLSSLFHWAWTFRDIELDNPSIAFTIPKDGRTNLGELAADVAAASANEEYPPPPEETADGVTRLLIQRVAVTGGAFTFADERGREPAVVKVSPLDLTLENIATLPDRKGPYTIEARFPRGGSVTWVGEVSLQPISSQGTLTINGLALALAYPFIKDQVMIEAPGGVLNLRTDYALAYDKTLGVHLDRLGMRFGDVALTSHSADSPSSAANRLQARIGEAVINLTVDTTLGGDKPMAATFDGSFTVADLDVIGADKKPFFSWKTLSSETVSFDLEARTLLIKDLILDGADGKLIIGPDGRINVASIGEAPSDGEPSTPTEPVDGQISDTKPFVATIERLRIRESKLDFADLLLRPDFHTRIHGLGGWISGLTTAPERVANLKLDGRVDRTGSVKIDGSLAPFDPTKQTEVAFAFRNIEMSSLTPYAAKFAGYRIESGRLDLDVAYKIRDNKLDGQHNIVLDKLTLGEKVESPDAFDAPLELAVAIMKDSRGVIDLDLPVTGDLNDPQFSYGHLIRKAIGNLLVKIVTAPFQFLASIFGVSGGKTLDQIAFAPGSSAIEPKEQEKLDAITKMLLDRPQLALEIEGRTDEAFDTRALRERAVEAEMAKRLDLNLAEGERPPPIDLASKDTRDELDTLFRDLAAGGERGVVQKLIGAIAPSEVVEKLESDAAAAATAQGLDKNAAKQLYYKMLYDRTVEMMPLPDDALDQLAQARAAAIQAALTNEGISPERVQLSGAAVAENATEDAVVSKMAVAAQ